MGAYAGDVGAYAGDVGEYAGDVGEYAGGAGPAAAFFCDGNAELGAGDIELGADGEYDKSESSSSCASMIDLKAGVSAIYAASSCAGEPPKLLFAGCPFFFLRFSYSEMFSISSSPLLDIA